MEQLLMTVIFGYLVVKLYIKIFSIKANMSWSFVQKIFNTALVSTDYIFTLSVTLLIVPIKIARFEKLRLYDWHQPQIII